MKTLIQTGFFLLLTVSSFLANAGLLGPSTSSVPEIGMGSAVLGFGLLVGLVALISERRRK